MIAELKNKIIATQNKDSEVVISVEEVSKKFCRDLKQSLFYGVQDIATDLIGGRRKSQYLRSGEFWALKDVGFQLRRGEALGLVGANGSGKSTLLRIISGLIKPDTGIVKVKGRVAPLIALGAGFNPILTGRENIYANMSILGLPTKKIKKLFDDVVDFAEIWEAIDAPVQTYSSGMAARLGFACAVHIEPDVLLIDEVLAVGDVKFKMKCHQRLAKLREKGTAFILVTHNPHSTLNVCDSAIYLKKGQLIQSGESEVIIRKYEEDLCLNGVGSTTGIMVLPRKQNDDLGLDILSLSFRDEHNHVLPHLLTGEPAYLCVECIAHKPINNTNLGVQIKSLSGENDLVLYLTSTSDQCKLKIPRGKVEIRMKMPYCGLVPGVYTSKIYLRDGIRTFDSVEAFRFTVKANRNTSKCLFYQPREWEIVLK
ncbi:ABC transporter ATP-binding protein [Gloeocapsopsis crepidinum LEGE 06123]|uniref:ABC transporter ATP-binding protein n=1 Tax=Gloeocapsopsis crepidinum LEGE 06123 TaxID=588587 RepID=A0ABR9ULT8_9CHRO|nr:ABC transporter ATP-binding protein [Gloeocapsopsis crepidinum]MBE9189243.1 ABC transporter ATP-binding protein [Gloeocapsopsis crepidinum LEGE 06123]